MEVETLIPVDEYLSKSYVPDKEYRDGVLVERNVGDKAHALLQALLAAYIVRRRKEWKVQVYTELRVRIRDKWYPIPDVCVYSLPDFEDRYPSHPPLLWIEILSHDDRMIDVWERADELIERGVPNIWIINPNTLESELRTTSGIEQVVDRTLRIGGTPIVIPLAEVLEQWPAFA